MSAPPPPHPSAALRERILSKARAAPSPTRSAVGKARLRLTIAALVPALLLFAAMGAGPKGRPAELALLVAVGWSAVAMAATALAFTSRSPLGPSRPALAILALAAPLTELLLAAAGALFFPDTWSGVLGPKHHAGCVMLTLMMGAAPLAAMLYHLRGLDPVGPRVRGAALGATAGAWAGTGAMLVCPHNGLSHVMLGHVAPVVLFSLVGYVVGGRVLAFRADRPS